jgi:hypothetical protein
VTTNRSNSNSTRQESHAITLWIDSYSDIFSDFDPRPFSDRMISEDFLNQLRRASSEFNEKIQVLQLLVPDGTQKEEEERIIRKRLHNYFGSRALQKAKELETIRSRAMYFLISGIIVMLVSSYIAFLKLSGFHINVMLVLFEPAGWFLFWTGLESLVSASQAKKAERSFYDKMSLLHIEFSPYKV